MPLYESTFIARHDMSTQQVENLAESFTNILTENGGKVTKTEQWGIKSLAYRIKKNRKGHYVHFNLDAPSAAVQELERNLRLSEDVLRYLTVRVDEIEEGSSVMMQARSGRDERGRRGGPGGRFGGSPRRDGPPPRREAATNESDDDTSTADDDSDAASDESSGEEGANT